MVLLGSGHSHTRRRKLATFAGGALISGGGSYMLVGAVGQLLPATGAATLRWALTAGGFTAAAWYVWPRWLPSTGRQVNRALAQRGYFGAGMYGAVLGLGWLTIVVTPFVWLGLGASLAAGSATWGGVYGVAFAGGRVAMLVHQYRDGQIKNDSLTVRTTLGRVGRLRWLGLVGALAAVGLGAPLGLLVGG
jgi:hypothetical protein